MAELIVKSTPLTRFLAWARALRLVDPATPHNAGNDFGSDIATTPKVDPIDEMSAYTLAWVFIAVQTCANDLACLPRKVLNAQGEPYDSHPFLDLWEQPRSSTSGLEYGRQRWADYYLSGNTYDRILRVGRSREVLSLHRLHPARCEHVTATNGDLRAIKYDTGGEPIHYDIEDVLVCRDISWERGPNGTRGMSRIRALMRDLNVDAKALDMAGQAASRGAPAFHISPEGEEIWDQNQVGEIAKSINALLAKVSGGALVTGGRTKVTPLTLTPKDLEFSQMRVDTRQAILSAFRIPPTIAGLPGANFATADKEAESYWTARMADAKVRDAVDSRLAAEMGSPGDYVVTDFSGVPALKESQDSTIARARALWDMGVPLDVALEFVGLEIQLPEIEAAPPPPPDPPPEDEPPADEDDGERLWTRADEQDDGDPAFAQWRQWEREVRGPAENRLRRELALTLRAQGDRIARRAVTQLGGDRSHTRADDDLIGSILGSTEELQALTDTADPIVRDAIEAAMAAIARQLGVTLLEDDTQEQLSRELQASLAGVQSTTDEAVTKIIRDGLAEGLSPTSIATRITQSRAFAPSRALTIARTEITRSSNAASVRAIELANEAGAGVEEVEWLSSEDEHVRGQHVALNHDRRAVDGVFEVEGYTAKAPGGFGTPHLDANCRCTIRAVL